jgi:integrase
MERLSAHDLRRTFVTLGVKACRLDIAKLELLTNHLPQTVTTKHYLETSDLRDYQPEVEFIAAYIEGEARVAAAKANGENVVSLPLRA